VFVGIAGAIESRSQKDGEVAWTRPLNDQVTSLYWDTGWLIAATKAGPLIVIRASDGEVLWQRDLGSLPHAPPVLAGERVFVALNDGRLVALSLMTGEIVWTQKMAEPGTGILALADRTYVGSLDDWFYCFDTNKGGRRWRFQNGADVVGTAVIDTRRVYYVALDNVLRALNRKNGGLMWKRLLPMRPTSGPLQVDDTLIIPGPAELHAYKAADGTAAGDFVMKGAQGEELQLAADPHLASDDTLVVLTKNGQVHALSGAPPPSAAPAPSDAAPPSGAQPPPQATP
jgi:outer membrane protein assembly factor BamB